VGGKSKAQTIGYKYYIGMHSVVCHGPIDFVTKFTVDDRVAWAGATSGGSIGVSAESLFGGESREGGVSGTVDVMMGWPTQLQNSYLVAKLGNRIPAYRGVVSIIHRQCYMGNNPYLKPWRYRGQRVQVRQDGQPQWNPNRAGILVQAGANLPNKTAVNLVATSFGSAPSTVYSPGRAGVIRISKPRAAASGGLLTYDAWSAWNNDAGIGGGNSPVPGQTWTNQFQVLARNGAGSFVSIFSGNDLGMDPNLYATADEAYAAADALLPITFTGWDEYKVQAAFDNNPGDNRGGLSLIVETGSGTIDLNGAHIIRECLTDPDWGMGYPESDVDDDWFGAAANTISAEELGISLLWDKQILIDAFIQEIVKHIDAALYVSRTTGKFVLKLIRGDYNPDDLITLDESCISRIEDPSRPSFGELTNSVTVNYWDHQTGKDASLTVTDTAMALVQGAVINTPVQYPGFSNARNATIAGQRDLRALSSPMLNCTIYVDSTAEDLNVGDVFKLNWSKWGIYQLVMRVTSFALGNGKSNQIKLTCVQDIFDTTTKTAVAEPGTGWEDPSQPPGPSVDSLAQELPYYELVQTGGQAQTDSNLVNKPDSGYVMGAAPRPTGGINARMWTDSGNGYESINTLDFCPYCELTVAVGKMETVWSTTGGLDMDTVLAGQHAQIGDEIVRIDAVDTVGNTITVGRGALDTVPQDHAATDSIFVWDLNYGADPTEYVAAEVVDVKIQPVSGSGTVDLGLITERTVTLDGRAWRPYAPGQFKVNGLYYDTSVDYSGELTLTWAHRDRLEQTGGTIVDHTMGDIGPEPGTLYRVQGYVDDVLVHTEDDIAGTTASWDPGLDDGVESGTVRVEVHAKRDGVYSWQAPWHEFLYGAAGQRVTEENDGRVTEGDELRVTED